MIEIDWPLLQKYIWHTSFQIWMMGPKMWSAPNKMEVLFNLCFIHLLPSHRVEAIEPRQPPFGPLTPRLGPSISLSGWNLTKLTIGKVHYKVCFINFVWKWLTTAAEVHGAQVQILGPKMCYAPLNHGCSITFVLLSFCQVSCLRPIVSGQNDIWRTVASP